MATITETLNLKLQQAQDKFHEYSSSVIQGLNTANIKPNVNKKLSVISYWLEMLGSGVPTCTPVEPQDPNDISIQIDIDNFVNLPGEWGCTHFEYFWTRNKHGEMVPLAKIGIAYWPQWDGDLYLGESLIVWQTQNSFFRYGFQGDVKRKNIADGNLTAPQTISTAENHSNMQTDNSFLGVRGPYNNADGLLEDKSVYYYSAGVGSSRIRVTMQQTTGFAEYDTAYQGQTTLTFKFKDVGTHI